MTAGPSRRLSSRQRRCLQALAEQGSWPATTGEFGWRPDVPVGDWARDSRRVLASLAELGLAASDGTTTLAGARTAAGLPGIRTARAHRYTITELGEQAAARV